MTDRKNSKNNVLDKDKFESIYSLYSKYLYAIGLRILKDEDYASDALQNCFLRIFENIHKIKDVDSRQTKSFVCIIMRNESINLYRKKKKMEHVTDSFDKTLYIKDENSEVEEIFARAEIKKDIQVYLKELNEEERDLIILKYLKEYSHEEIADILHISQDSVRQRLSRIRKKLAIVVMKDKEKEEA